MSEIPSGFISKQTFKSLPQLAFFTWFTVFVIDAILLQQMKYSYQRVLFIWVTGLVVSFFFEFLRFRYLPFDEKRNYKRIFLILNSFLIFLYASSYTGLTKQIGAWGDLTNTVNEKGKSTVKTGVFLLDAIEWAIPVLAKQTSYFPDIEVIDENNELKQQTSLLKDSLSACQLSISKPVKPDSLQNINSDLQNQLTALLAANKRLSDSLNESEKLYNQIAATNESLIRMNTSLTAENTILKNQNDSLRRLLQNSSPNGDLKKQIGLLESQVKTLLARIDGFNTHQSKWKLVSAGGKETVKSAVNRYISQTKNSGEDFYTFLFETPIDNSLK